MCAKYIGALARRFVNAHSKWVAQRLNPLEATLTEKPGEGARGGGWLWLTSNRSRVVQPWLDARIMYLLGAFGARIQEFPSSLLGNYGGERDGRQANYEK